MKAIVLMAGLLAGAFWLGALTSRRRRKCGPSCESARRLTKLHAKLRANADLYEKGSRDDQRAAGQYYIWQADRAETQLEEALIQVVNLAQENGRLRQFVHDLEAKVKGPHMCAYPPELAQGSLHIETAGQADRGQL